MAYLIKPIIDDGLRPTGTGSALPDPGTLAFWSGAVLAAYLAKGIGAYFSAYLMTDIGQRVVRDLRDQLFRHILNQSAAFFSRWSTGPLMSRITNDVNLVQQAVSETVGDLLREGLSLFGYAALLFWWDWRLALVCVTGAPIVVYPLVRLGQRVRRSTRRSQEAIERLSHIAAEAFTGHRIVKAFGAEEHESQRFKRASELLYRINLKITSTVAMLPPLMELLGGLAVVGLIWYGSGEISQGRTTQGSFLGFIFAAFMMYTPIKKLSRVNTNLQQAMAASERIFTMLDTHTEVGERPDARPLKPTRASVEFQNVAFAYDDGHAKYVLRDVSFCVDGGQLVAVVGLSGAGKTTLLNLIPRFYDVTAGAVLIDGTDIRDVTLKSLARADWHRHAGDGAVRRHHCGEHRLRLAWRLAGGDRGGGACRARARVHPRAAEGLPDAHRRARPEALGRPAAADCDRAGAAEECADPDPRRSHLGAGRRIRAAGAGRADRADAAPHGVRDRAPPVDRPPCRQDRGAGEGAHCRDRPARRFAGEARGCLREAVCTAGIW